MNKEQMIYPSETAAPSVYTEFINGVKFDICEVYKGCYDLLNSPKYRFFVCVEDNHICGYESADKFFASTGECRWDIFCKTKSDCKILIQEFSKSHDMIEKLLKRAENKPTLKRSSMGKVNSIRERMISIFGTYPL